MVTPEQILEAGTVATLVVAMLIFLVLISAKVRRGSRLRGDFTLLLWAFVLGWLGAEVLQILSPPYLTLLAEIVHFAVIFLFTVFLALRWRWALRAATEEVLT